MNRDQGLRLAREVKNLLLQRKYPVHRVILFGSVAKGTSRPSSDIDIAVIIDPFRTSPMQEKVDVHLASMEIDGRIETVTFRPEDLRVPFFSLAREIERTGVEV